MFWKCTLAALAVLALGMTSASAQGPDLGAKVYRLGDVSAFASERPDGTDSDTILVGHGGGHGGHGGGFHGGGFHGGGFHGGGFHSASFHHGSFHHGFHGGNRSFFSFGFGYPYYGYGYYRPYYGYYSPYYYSPYYYSSPTYYYYPSYCYYPTSLNSAPIYSGSVGVAYPQAGGTTIPPMRRADENYNVPPVPPEEQGTFPYNGGPTAPVPLPGAAPVPQKSAPIDPAQGRIVSLPAKLPKYVYSAYGQKPAGTTPADRPVLVKGDATGR